jgi:hypothetical protein
MLTDKSFLYPKVTEMRPKISLPNFEFSSCAVTVDGNPKLEDWGGPLLFSIWCQRASPWWIGDLLIAGDARFGEDFSQVCEGAVSADMLQRYESVARRVPPENRRPNLSWSAHAVAARLPHDKQRVMLEKAERYGWSSEVLRIKVRELVEEAKREQ